jgi:hypothetical protein
MDVVGVNTVGVNVNACECERVKACTYIMMICNVLL